MCMRAHAAPVSLVRAPLLPSANTTVGNLHPSSEGEAGARPARCTRRAAIAAESGRDVARRRGG
jgi:hypothetical protein